VKERYTTIGQSLQSVWEYEERIIPLEPTSMLLVRVLLGKISNIDQLRSAFENTPVRGDQPGYEHWNCVEWIREALDLIQDDEQALGTSVTDWNSVRNTAMWYVEKKKRDHRFDGQGQYDQKKAATWDMLERRELIS
jgi:hypothetical protein